jgi:hypothetical protein
MSIKEKFHITGLFYEEKGYKFHKYLHIKKVNTRCKNPDILAVLMNPGGSKPVDGIDDNTEESEAIPDRTQDQIMKVMIACKLQYARVLNLSDIREPKSNKMLLKLLEMDKKEIPHSIFDDRRREDFDSLFTKDIPIIFAWGVSIKLQNLAENAIKIIDADYPIGMAKEDLKWAFYHPLPQNYNKQADWVAYIIKQLKSNLSDKS